MWIATIVVSTILGLILTYSAGAKLLGGPKIAETYAKVGVPPRMLPVLAVLLLTGALGVAVGLWWSPLEIAAGACLVVYFAIAIAFHVRYRQTSTLLVPLLIFGLAATLLTLSVMR
jgi:uncharacterized membrane protein YphA (DoxX/SURF4 family)